MSRLATRQQTSGERMRKIPGELRYLPLLRDIIVLPCLVYYLGYWVYHVAAIPVCLDGRQADRVSQPIFEDQGDQRRRNIQRIRYRNEEDEKNNGSSSIHQKLLQIIGIEMLAVNGQGKFRVLNQAPIKP